MSTTATAETDGRLLATVKKNSREVVRVIRKTFEGHDVIDGRVWVLSAVPGTDPTPTKRGLCCKPETWREIAAAVLAEVGNEAPVESGEEGTPER